MAFRINPLPIRSLPLPARRQLFRLPINRNFSVSCTSKKISHAEMASALAEEVARVHARKKQRDEALSKSRAILFKELCEYASMTEDEMKDKWRRIGEGERLGMVVEFVSNWSPNFHPLSVRSTKEMIEEHLEQEDEEVSKAMEKMEKKKTSASASQRFSSDDWSLFPILRRGEGW